MSSSLKDNRTARGTVGGFLRAQIQADTKLSFTSAYFTVNAFEALRSELESASSLRFLFGEPSFISEMDSDKDEKKNFRLTEEGLELSHALTQRPAAKARAVDSIKTTFSKRAAAALFSGRSGLLPTESDTPNSSADLELVTWLVIMANNP